MIIGFVVIVVGLGILMLLERKFPDQKLPEVKGWWSSVLFINAYQLLVVLLAIRTWERWFQIPSLLNLSQYMGPFAGGLVAYLINTWIFYWWHRARHEIYFLWLGFHQFHHSARRIEAITSFYKHPLEILVDSVMMALLLYPILGLNEDCSVWLSGFSAFGEYFYHMNIKTPRWVGYIFQRPESHRIHHLRNKRADGLNYSDISLWDILAGTFKNPNRMDGPTGFDADQELKRFEMICFKDVVRKCVVNRRDFLYTILLIFVLFIGMAQPIGYVFGWTNFRGIAIATTASPLPLVFTHYNRTETFSTTFVIEAETKNNTKIEIELTKKIYNQIKGPYNLRNVYGVIFSHGPFFQSEPLIKLRQQVLHYGICQQGLNLDSINSDIARVNIRVKSKTKGNENKQWLMSVEC